MIHFSFKYYYLLFSDPDLISLDDYVLNTEAHPFRIEAPEKLVKSLWAGPDPDLDKSYDPPGMKKGERGFGTFLQQWSRVDLDKISETDRQVYNKVMGVHA
jgi:mannosyl-oligosaccharide alpha-1,2-mannosidase